MARPFLSLTAYMYIYTVSEKQATVASSCAPSLLRAINVERTPLPSTPSQPAKKPTPGALASKLRVTKKLATTNRGAIKLAQQFGDALVCVRHRTDSEARFRYTTVELLVDKVEMQPRQSKMVHIRIHAHEYGLRTVVRAAGAVCDRRTGLWHIPKRVATVLRLTGRIVQAK